MREEEGGERGRRGEEREGERERERVLLNSICLFFDLWILYGFNGV
jgi:hypothetical protein